jgi:hypothetical protein
MHFKFLVNVFLMCSTTLYSMDLTIFTNFTNFSDDCISIICSRFDRPERNNLKCTNKKYFKLILSQDEVNNNYRNAHMQQDESNMIYWKNMGGWLPHQEFANAIKNKKISLAKSLLKNNKVAIYDVYCCNIEEAVKTSTIDQVIPVLKWLMDTRSTRAAAEYLSGYELAKNLKEKYPQAQEIVDFIHACLIEKKQYKKSEERHYVGWWHDVWSM